MRFWPLWVVIENPELPARCAKELRQFYAQAPSDATYHVAIDIARRTPAIEAPNTVIIETLGAPAHRMYTEHPEAMEWLRLERTSIMDHDGFSFFITDPLH